MTRLCLNMIVKNESARIVRALESVAPFISYWVIQDTGSTDDTVEKIEHFFKTVKIPGAIVRGSFKDFAQSRNDALRSARLRAGVGDFSYILLMDADMELVVKDIRILYNLTAPSYDVYQHAGQLQYQNRRLVRADIANDYKGVTHEFLDAETGGCLDHSNIFFNDYADGTNRKDKFIRDIRLLKNGLKVEPKNERYMFYLAQSFKDAAKPAEAIRWYDKRIAAGGWEEEVWYSQFMKAQCYWQMGKEAEYLQHLMLAYEMRPRRKEPLYLLARYYRDRGKNHAATLFAGQAITMSPSGDCLFTDDFMETVGPLEELSISGFYVDGKRALGFEATDKLSLARTKYSGSVELARRNMFYYLPKLVDVCPSFTSQQIDFTPDPGWNALNPSVTMHQGHLHCLVRTVNYRMDEDGRYWIGDKWPNDEYPITTRNHLLGLHPDLSVSWHEEVKPDSMPDPLFKAVRGFEDMRIFSVDGQLCSSSTVREMAADGYPEQVLARIELTWRGNSPYLVDIQKMLREPRQTEKNWTPIVIDGKQLRFMYRLGEIVDVTGKTVWKEDTGLSTGHISGGSQLIPLDGGWVSLVHEARPLPDKEYKRYYWHRFAFFNDKFQLQHLSRPFTFLDKQIEFAAGICVHPDGNRLVISFGVRDCEAHIGTVATSEVRKL